jgi:hypothetical protein
MRTASKAKTTKPKRVKQKSFLSSQRHQNVAFPSFTIFRKAQALELEGLSRGFQQFDIQFEETN